MTTTDAVTGSEQIQLAEHRGFALGLKAARDQVVSMKASEGVLDKSTQNLIATSLSISITKARHGHPPPAPDAVARLGEAMKHLHDIINCGNCSGSRQSARLALRALAAMETSHD